VKTRRHPLDYEKIGDQSQNSVFLVWKCFSCFFPMLS